VKCNYYNLKLFGLVLRTIRNVTKRYMWGNYV